MEIIITNMITVPIANNIFAKTFSTLCFVLINDITAENMNDNIANGSNITNKTMLMNPYDNPVM